jgi:hypothetical protein
VDGVGSERAGSETEGANGASDAFGLDRSRFGTSGIVIPGTGPRGCILHLGQANPAAGSMAGQRSGRGKRRFSLLVELDCCQIVVFWADSDVRRFGLCVNHPNLDFVVRNCGVEEGRTVTPNNEDQDRSQEPRAGPREFFNY